MKSPLALVVSLAVLVLSAAPAAAGPTSLLENLGGAIYRDLSLSLNQNQACMSCHHPSAGFADPNNRIAPTQFPVSEGSVIGRFGGRNAPSAAYAGFSPIFYYDPGSGLFLGGAFWDGRATGWRLGDPLAEQALGPFLNPVEMALSDPSAVVAIVQAAEYARLFKRLFGPNAFVDVATAYDNIGRAIAAFERGDKVTKFRSKFDRFVAEQGGDVSDFGVAVQPDGFRQYIGPPPGFRSQIFTYQEADGLAIFNADSTNDGAAATAGGMCYACHVTTNFSPVVAPLLTDFSYDNLGLPVNPRIADLAGPQGIDLGLGGRAVEVAEAYLAAGGTGDVQAVIDAQAGKFKVPTLRNVARSAPYGHNGYFATLYDIVHFYNTRDVGTWPDAEVPTTVNTTELGNLGLTFRQERNLVLFLETLTD